MLCFCVQGVSVLSLPCMASNGTDALSSVSVCMMPICVQGVSVLSRRASPQHVYPFALVLSEVAKGAAEAAADAAAVAKQAQVHTHRHMHTH